MVGFGSRTEPPLLLSVLKGYWTWGLSLSLNWGAHTMDAPIFTLVAFWWHWQFSSGMTLLHHINLCCWYLVPSGVDPHMTWERSHLVWISLWLVAIGWHLVLYVAILAAGLGVVVTPWHGNHALHISATWKDCSPVVGALMTAWWVVLDLLLPTTRDYLYYTTILWNNKTQGQRSHFYSRMFVETFK